jgi:hypothetical protein
LGYSLKATTRNWEWLEYIHSHHGFKTTIKWTQPAEGIGYLRGPNGMFGLDFDQYVFPASLFPLETRD